MELHLRFMHVPSTPTQTNSKYEVMHLDSAFWDLDSERKKNTEIRYCWLPEEGKVRTLQHQHHKVRS